MTDDDLECFGTIRDKALKKLEGMLEDDWTELLWINVRNDGRLSVEISRMFGWAALREMVEDAISEAVAMVRSGKDREIIAELDARDAKAGSP